MSEPVTLVVLAAAALKGASGALGNAVARIGVTRFERQFQSGRTRERLIGHAADAIIDIRELTAAGNGGGSRNEVGRTELVWFLERLDEKRSTHLFVEQPKHGDATPDQSYRTGREYDAQPEAHWLYPIALWLVAVVQAAEQAEEVALPRRIRVDNAFRRGAGRVTSAARRVMPHRKESKPPDKISISGKLNDVGVPKLRVLRDVDREAASRTDGLVGLVTDKNSGDIAWWAEVLDNLGWRLTCDRGMDALVQHLRFEAQQRRAQTLIRELAVAVAAVTVLGLSSIVGAVWLLAHW